MKKIVYFLISVFLFLVLCSSYADVTVYQFDSSSNPPKLVPEVIPNLSSISYIVSSGKYAFAVDVSGTSSASPFAFSFYDGSQWHTNFSSEVTGSTLTGIRPAFPYQVGNDNAWSLAQSATSANVDVIHFIGSNIQVTHLNDIIHFPAGYINFQDSIRVEGGYVFLIATALSSPTGNPNGYFYAVFNPQTNHWSKTSAYIPDIISSPTYLFDQMATSNILGLPSLFIFTTGQANSPHKFAIDIIKSNGQLTHYYPPQSDTTFPDNYLIKSDGDHVYAMYQIHQINYTTFNNTNSILSNGEYVPTLMYHNLAEGNWLTLEIPKSLSNNEILPSFQRWGYAGLFFHGQSFVNSAEDEHLWIYNSNLVTIQH